MPRSVQRMRGMVEGELRKGEELQHAVPVWIGGTYVPFLGSIVVAVALAAGMASALGANGLIVTAVGAATGALTGRYIALRAVGDHPLDAAALQVFLGVTRKRVLIYEPRSWGKPGRLLASIPRGQVGDIVLVQGNFLRPSRLSFLAPNGLHTYECSGLWNVDDIVEALGR
ncbi:MAG TPA: hypothetical protein VLG28_02095 [Acidimicrobiia bacterium]|nr:hypothetical protein [Acidimicrobiia bacterium]